MSKNLQGATITQEEICKMLRMGDKPKTEIPAEDKATIERLMVETGMDTKIA